MNFTQRRLGISTTLLAAAALLTAASTARAVIDGAAFTIDIGPSARVLNAIGTPDYDHILMDESCDNPHLRIHANNKPSIKITAGSTLDADAEISTFTLTIKNTDYLFGNGDAAGQGFAEFVKQSVYTDAGVSVVGNTLSADMRTLTVNFDGLTAGKSVIFQVDLDAINDPSMFQFPDFRNVLHGAPLTTNSPPTDPAMYSGTFIKASESLPVMGTLTQITTAPLYSNAHVRPYHVMDMVEVTTTETVPEPATNVLLALAGAGLLGLRRRRNA